MQKFSLYRSAQLVKSVHAVDIYEALAKIDMRDFNVVGDMAYKWFVDSSDNSYAIEIIPE